MRKLLLLGLFAFIFVMFSVNVDAACIGDVVNNDCAYFDYGCTSSGCGGSQCDLIAGCTSYHDRWPEGCEFPPDCWGSGCCNAWGGIYCIDTISPCNTQLDEACVLIPGCRLTECSDGIDNDDPEDALADAADPDCNSTMDPGTGNYIYNPYDDTETNAPPPVNPPICGDGNIDSPNSDGFYEQCDDGANGNNFDECNDDCTFTKCGDTFEQSPNGYGIHEVCDDGNTNPNDDCTYPTCKIATCGDGKVWNQGSGTEECDDDNGYNTDSCTNECKNAYCGDGYCYYGVETPANCFADCVNNFGWDTVQDGWALIDGSLKGSKKNIWVFSDPMALKAEKEYIISANIHNPNSVPCNASVDLDGGRCINASNWEETACFDDSAIKDAMRTTDTTNWTYRQSGFSIPAGEYVDPDGFVNGVRIKLYIWCGDGASGNLGAGNEVYFDNVQLREVVPSDIHYDTTPLMDASNACCPKTWCWNGTSCVNSTIWHNDSQEAPIWNDIFIPEDRWFTNHVNRSAQDVAQGYRCVLNDTGVANWVPAVIKYDYNFNESGYCNHPDNCFVSKTFNDMGQDEINALIGSYGTGDACIQNNTFVDDSNKYGFGNHLCLEGEWTTRTFVAASYLTAWAENKPYVLLCGNNHIFNYDLDNPIGNYDIYGDGLFPALSDSCSIIIKDSANHERVMLAIIPYNISETVSLAGAFVEEHNRIFTVQASPPLTIPDNCFQLTDEWWDCIRPGIQQSDPNIEIYYNNNSKFLVITDRPINIIDPTAFQQLWNYILNFFQRLFGLGQQQQYKLFKATSNYNRIYVLNKTPLYIEGIEEQKYDEVRSTLLTYLYLNHTPNTTDYNINIDYINKSYSPVSLSYVNAYGTKEFIMISDRRSELWPYLTAMLRDR